MEFITLNNGVQMPCIGMGGWAQKSENIIDAINVGYRLIDTAAQYENEAEIGKAVAECGVPRDKLFVTTKLWTEDIRQRRVKEAFKESLNRLGLEYIDLYIIHWPAAGFEEAYLVMEELYREGFIKAIGVSNFEVHHLDELTLAGATITPAVDQIESHPYFTNDVVVEECKKRGIVPEAWCPLGGPGSGELNDDVIKQIAKIHNKTTAQVIVRWHYQRGVVAIPKTSNPERASVNRDVFDFILSEDEMKMISGLDKGLRLGAHPDNFDF